MHIAILTGGISTEREVALRSAANMKNWCDISGHTSILFDLPGSLDAFIETYKSYDLIIPVFHGMYGEDGQITAFLSTLGCPYAYSDFTVHAGCMDKYRTNLLVEQLSVKIPKSLLIVRGQRIESLVSPLICYPVIVKPNHWGSSIATSKVTTREELTHAQSLIEWDDILVQECIEWCEFTVWVYYDSTGYHALPIMEIVTGGKLFDYSEKYETDGSNEIFANLTQKEQINLESQSITIAKTLGTRWVVRIDWRYDAKHMYFLEVNTIPGFTASSFIPKMWKQAWKSEKEFVEMLCV